MANDLYRGLVKSKYDSFSSGYWWGRYSNLNDIEDSLDLSDSALLKMQIDKLRSLERAEGIDSNKYKEANKFLLSAMDTPQKLDESSQAQNIISGQLIQLLNSAFWSSDINANKTGLIGEEHTRERDARIGQILDNLDSILCQINLNEKTSKEIFDKLENILVTNKGVLKQGLDFYQYIQYKAQSAEEIMVQMLAKNEGYEVLNAGKIRDSLHQQLLEDVMVFDKNTIDNKIVKSGIGLNFSINKIGNTNTKTTLHAKSIEEFIDKLKKLDGNYTIELSDELYKVLYDKSIINAQVKTAIKNESLLNSNLKNSISLEDMGYDSSDFLYELWTLNKTNAWYKGKGSNSETQQSNTLNDLFNYKLSQSIGMTNVTRNQLYLTTEGITSASRWLELRKRMLKFNPGIYKIDGNFLMRSHQYNFSKITS